MKWNKYTLTLLIVVLTFVSNSVLPSTILEAFYFNGLYQLWRVCYDYTLGLLPIPFLYIVLAGLLILLISVIRRKQILKWKNAFLFLAWVYILFIWMWSFNYRLPTIKERLTLNTPQLTDSIIMLEVSDVAHRLNALSSSMSEASLSYEEMESSIRPVLEAKLSEWKIPTHGRVRVRKIKPKGILLRWATAGVYIPYVSEGHIDGGLHPIQWASTCAHEMAHGYGLTDEGECNFVALLTCLDHPSEKVQYSGLILYYRYLYSSIYSDEKLRESAKAMLNEKVKYDLQSIRETLNQYPDILPEFRQWIYDLYLKNNGVKSGVKSYGQVVNLIFDYKQKYDFKLDPNSGFER